MIMLLTNPKLHPFAGCCFSYVVDGHISNQSRFLQVVALVVQYYVMSQKTSWKTPRGRYDEHNSKFFLSMKSKFNRPVGERNHF
jgi:hypothetical protein